MLAPLLALAFAATAAFAAGQPCLQNPSTVFFKLGNLTAQVTTDGPLISTTNGFAVPDAAIEHSYRLLRRSTTPAVLSLNTVVATLSDNTRILIEAGSPNVPFPDFASAGLLPAHLRAAGTPPESIHAVLLTHGHFDHVAGLVDRNGAPTFPNARVYITRTEHAYWGAAPFLPSSRNLDNATAAAFAQLYKRSVAPYVASGRLVTVRDGESPLPGVTFVETPGHAPGLAVVRLASDGAELFAVGDAWISRADQLRHPEWPFFSEHNTTQGFESRIRLLDRLADSDALVVAYHEPFPGLGHVVRTAYGYDWVPAQTGLLGAVQGICKG